MSGNVKGKSHLKLHRFSVIDTDSRDAMRDVFVHRYGAKGFDSRKNAQPFRGIANYLGLKTLDLSYGALSCDVSAIFAGNDLVRQQLVLSGQSRIGVGQMQFDVDTSGAAVIPSESDFRCDFRGDFSQLFLRIPATALRTRLSGLLGRPIASNIEFEIGPVHQTPEQMRLRRLIEYFIGEIDRDDGSLGQFQLAEFEQLLIVSFLTANPHKFSHLLQGEELAASPWQVRRVEEYIEANWQRPLTIEELASETGVGVRSMFITFKKARGYTPMSFLQRVRLQHARRMLQAPGAATSVTAVGLLCGFHNAGHFARYYRQAFNELPSATLAAAKGARRKA